MATRLRVSAFVLVAMIGMGVAESSQAIAEGFLVSHEQKMHGMVNQTRSQQGLAPVQHHDGLRIIARRQTQQMAARGYIFHTPDLAAQAASVSLSWSLLGENVGVGASVERVQEAFLNSPGHRQNIVDARYDALGVGVIADSNGTLYFSQNFAALRGSAPAPAPAAPAPAPAPAAPAPAAPAPAAPAVPAPQARPQAPAVQPVATPAPTPVSTPAPTPDPLLSEVSGTAGEGSLTPASVAGQVEQAADPNTAARTAEITLPRMLASMLGRALVNVAFWK